MRCKQDLRLVRSCLENLDQSVKCRDMNRRLWLLDCDEARPIRLIDSKQDSKQAQRPVRHLKCFECVLLTIGCALCKCERELVPMADIRNPHDAWNDKGKHLHEFPPCR